MLSDGLDCEFIEKLKNITIQDDTEFNFFDLSGAWYLENLTSDLMALFMGGRKRYHHGCSKHYYPAWMTHSILMGLISRLWNCREKPERKMESILLS